MNKLLSLNDKTTRACFFISGLFLFGYVLLRAWRMSFTWDEAYTYLHFVRDHAWLPYDFTNMAANNHLLNTWLMKCSVLVLGNSEPALRLPNVLGMVLYLFFAARLVRVFEDNFYRLLAFLFLGFNPYLLDFFSAARGYGLSMACMMGALYFTMTYFTGGRNVLRALAALFFSMLAVLANLSLFIFLMALAGVFVVSIIHHQFLEKRLLKTVVQLLLLLLPAIKFVLLLLPYTLKLRDCGALFFGGEHDFFTDTLVSLVSSSLYGLPGPGMISVILASLLLLLLAAAIYKGVKILKGQEVTGDNNFFLALLALALACALGSMLQHYLLGTKFLQQRTALFFYPLLVMLFVFLLQPGGKKSWLKWSAALGALLMLGNFAKAANLSSLYDWKEEAGIKNIMDKIGMYDISHSGFNNTVSTELLFEQGVNYYRVRNKLYHINTASRDDDRADLFIVTDQNRPKYSNAKELMSSGSVYVLQSPGADAHKVILDSVLDFEGQPGERPVNVSGEQVFRGRYAAFTDATVIYSDGFTFTLPPNKGWPLRVSTSAMIRAGKNDFDGRLVISFEHADHQVYSWQCCNIRDFLPGKGEWKQVKFTCEVPQEMQGGDILKVYLWNFGESSLFMDDLEVRLILLN